MSKENVATTSLEIRPHRVYVDDNGKTSSIILVYEGGSSRTSIARYSSAVVAMRAAEKVANALGARFTGKEN